MNSKTGIIFVGFVVSLGLATFVYAQMDTMNAAMDNEDAAMMNSSEPMNETVADDAEDEATDETAGATQAIAIVEGTKEGSELYGEVELTETKDGLAVTAEVYNAPPGKHGIHIHENGKCDDAGNAAGGHFNPDGVQHGMVAKDGLVKAHVGDLGNIEVDEYGDGYLSTVIPGASLTQGNYNVTGKAVILHEKEDDMGQPTGNAGGRIGCGIIEAAE